MIDCFWSHLNAYDPYMKLICPTLVWQEKRFKSMPKWLVQRQCLYHQNTWQISFLIIVLVSEFFCHFRWIYCQHISFFIDYKSLLEIKVNFLQKFYKNFSNSSEHEANFLLPEKLKKNDSSFYWKEVSYHRANGYEQVGETYFSGRKEVHKTKECLYRDSYGKFCQLFYICKKREGPLGSLSWWAC